MANASHIIQASSVDGTTNTFNIPFSYISESHLAFYVDDVLTTDSSSLYTATVLTGGTTVQIVKTSDSSNPDNVTIKLERNTPISTASVVFSNSSTLKASDLNTANTQWLYAVQEAADDAADAIRLDTSGVYDAKSIRIKNVANPTANQDAVTKYYLENTWLSPTNKTALTTVNANISNINSVNSNETNINTLAARNSDLVTLGALGTEIGNLGTADAVADMNTLAVSDVISDMNLLATADIISDMNTLATADIVSDMNQLAVTDVISDMNTLATTSNVTNMSTVAGSISSVNTTATNIASINTVAADLSEGTSEIDTVATSITNVNNVGNSIASVNTVSGISSAVSTVSGISSAVSTVSGISSDVSAVSDKATEIGRLGTADAVSDMNTLGTADVVQDLAILGTADVVSDMNTLATTDIVSDMNTLATTSNVNNMSTLAPISGNITTVAGISSDVTTTAGQSTEISRLGTADAVSDMNTLGTTAVVSDMDTVAGSISSVTTTATNIASVNTTATNIAGVNSFAERYRVAASAPTSSLDEGDLYYDTTSDKLRFYDGSTWNDSYLSSSGGSVTSVGVSGANGITVVSGSPVTTSGTIALSLDAPDYPTIRPSLSLNFARSGALDPRVTYTRSSTGTFYDATGKLQTAAAGTARFDHDPATGEALGLLVEGAKTNLNIRSEEFDNAAWYHDGSSSITATTGTAPDGGATADTWNGAGYFTNASGMAVSASTTYTASVFMKGGTATSVSFSWQQLPAYGVVAVATCNPTTGAISVTTGTGTVTDVGDGWYRYTLTGTIAASGQTHARLVFDTGGGSGTGTVLLWGAQFELGNVSSYTGTTSGSVTRAADVATLTTDVSWLDAAEGTILVEGHLPTVTTANQYFLSIDNGSSEDSILIFKASSASNTTRALVIDGYTYQSDIKNGTSWADGATRQFSTGYKANDFALYESGSSVGTDTTGTLPSPTQLRIGRSHANTEHLDGHLKRIAYYPKRATNAQLAALTG